jgi:peptidyl-prolyl cis-trans isomerase B (cyclophilin B)
LHDTEICLFIQYRPLWYGTITTEFGDVIVEHYPDAAPNTVENFKKLAKSGFYDGLIFHRIVD